MLFTHSKTHNYPSMSSEKPKTNSLDQFFKNNKRKTVSAVTSASIRAKTESKEKKCAEGKSIQQKISKMNELELQAYLEDMTKTELEQILLLLDDIYFNMTSEEAKEFCVSDFLYDTIKKFYETKFDCDYTAVGALPRAGNNQVKIRLSEWAPSLKKATDEKEFKSRRNKLAAVNAKKTVRALKVDGESVRIYVRKPITDYFLTTRGNGYIGVDITHILPEIRHRLPKLELVQGAGISSIRAELVIKKADFEELKKNPPATLRSTNGLSNARNVLVGQVNAKNSGCLEILKLISVIAYEVRYEDPSNPKQNSVWEQMQDLQRLGFETPNPTLQDINYTYQEACEALLAAEATAPYEIDGLVEYAEDYDVKLDTYDNGGFRGEPQVLSDEEVQKLKKELGDDCPRPEIHFAIKLSSTYMKLRGVKTTVLRVEWQTSRYGRLFPVIHVQPVIIDGKTIKQASGKKAKLIKDDKIGPGSECHVVFAGSVIPEIFDVTPSNSGQGSLPDHLDYVWSETGEHIYLKNPEISEEVQLGRIQFLFDTLECKNVGDETIRLLFTHYNGNLSRILQCTVEDLLQLPGFQATKANNTVTSIQHSISSVSLVQAMYASCKFGEALGVSRLQDIVDAHPTIMQWEVTENVKHLMVEKLQKIRGLKKLAIQFVDQLSSFQEWMKQHPMIQINELTPEFQSKRQATHVSMFQLPENIVFTGFTNQIWENILKSNGSKLQSAVTSKTALCVTKTLGSDSGKEKKAELLKIPIMTMADFQRKYELP